MSNANIAPKSKKMTVGTLAIMNITAVVSLRFIPSEAEYGLGAIFYYTFAAIMFLVPVAFVAAELATTYPQKGGAFRWIGEAFGARWGFVGMLMTWLQVIPYFPTVLTFGAVSVAFIDVDMGVAESIASNKWYILFFVLFVYWGAICVALRGVGIFSQVSKWCGIIGTIIPAIILVILGFSYLWFSGKPAVIPLGWGDLFPNIANFQNIVLAASIFLAYAGMEMNAVHVNDLDNPTKKYPIAITIASIGTIAIFLLSTLGVAFIIPTDKISLTQSLLVAYDMLFEWAGVPWLGSVMAFMLAIGVLGGVVTWIAGPNTGVLAIAKAGYLPKFFQKTNRHGMGHHLMFVQGIIVSVLSVTFVIMPSVQAAFQILSQLTVMLYLVMYMLMFASAIYLRHSQPDTKRPYRAPALFFWATLGFLGSFLAFVLSFIPPEQIPTGSPTSYVLYLLVLVSLFLLIPILIYAFRKSDWKDPNSDFEPFSWEKRTSN
ncbi:TPA: putative glutamine/gamma-aminobutyrate antiporter GadC [Shigella dysenteriae]